MSLLPTTLVPSTPARYQPGYVVRHPIGALNLVALVLSIVLVPLLAVIIWALHGGSSEPQVDISFTLVDIAGACSTAMITIVVHELIHGIVLRLFGYRVSFGVEYRLFVAYAAAFRQIQTRNHALMTALAPVGPHASGRAGALAFLAHQRAEHDRDQQPQQHLPVEID